MKNIAVVELIGFCTLFLSILAAPLKAQSARRVDGAVGDNLATESPLACNLNALDAKQRIRVHELIVDLRSGVQQVKELPNGYSMRLSNDASNILKLGEYISLERLCCPFFDFAIEAQREGGPVWIMLTGGEGVKDLARSEFEPTRGDLNNADEKAASGQRQSPLVCNEAALGAARVKRLTQLVHEVGAAKQEVRELPDGYAVRLPSGSALVRDVAEYMSILRICSPYFETRLEVGCQSGPVWLTMTGREGVKDLAKTELGV
jgi:hypothetical protein